MPRHLTTAEYQKIMESSFLFWAEDDAAPDAERLDAALKRIFEYWPNGRQEVYTDEQPDATYHVFEDSHYWVIVCASYPTNNAIYLAKKEGK